MKSWISFLLPDDEYREKKILYYLSEGSIILLIFLTSIIIINRYIPYFQIDLEFSLFLAIWIFIGYVFVRFIMSGMEYTDISTEQVYKRGLKVTFVKSFGFVVTFFLLYLAFLMPSNTNEWFGIIGTSIVAGLILFFSDYISLKRSYKKNKDLL